VEVPPKKSPHFCNAKTKKSPFFCECRNKKKKKAQPKSGKKKPKKNVLRSRAKFVFKVKRKSPQKQ